MTDRQLARRAPEPRRVTATPDDVIDLTFDACSEGTGWGPEHCQEISPDGGHKCYDDAPWKGLGHEVYHWCGCDKTWPLTTTAPDDHEVLGRPYDVSSFRFRLRWAPDPPQGFEHHLRREREIRRP